MNLKENISFSHYEYLISSVTISKFIMIMFFFMVLLMILYIFLTVKENS
ncbi:hypothetical protein [Oceanirhabdus sp. W0125-5]|nr:hypothetical protein [Oceanirhabdus sp. W0125-5]WBW99134.1 hypothetical protein OW730_10415 [Oceanirhabdus sp. W0125-5]